MRVFASAVFAILLCGVSVTSAAPLGDGVEGDDLLSKLTKLWQDWRASGTLRADYFQSTQTLDDRADFVGATAQIKALPVITADVDGKVDLRVTDPALGRGDHLRVLLLEGYATVHFDRADLQIGKQIIAWGRADGINPTDNVSPRDYTVMLPFEDDQRLGVTALKLDYYLSQEYTLTVLAAPLFEPSDVPVPSGSIMSVRRPGSGLANTQVGARLNKVGGDFDWSVSYYRGFSLLPTVQAGELGSALDLHYDRISVVGADFARNFGRFGLRGEIAYVNSADDSNRDTFVKHPYLFWILGVDRTFYEYLNFNVQFFERLDLTYQDPGAIADPQLRRAADLNGILEGLTEYTNHGMSFRISEEWMNETLRAEVFGVSDLTGNSYYLRPLVTWAFTDNLKGTVGANIYGGGQRTQYGIQVANSGAFVELRYGF